MSLFPINLKLTKIKLFCFLCGFLFLILFLLVSVFLYVKHINKMAKEVTDNSKYVLDVLSEANVRVRVFSEKTLRYDAYVHAAENIIFNAYDKYKIPVHKRMSPVEISQFLNLIYSYADSGLYEGTDVWLALAYAEHESHFIRTAKGNAGDRGLFQFIPSTSSLLLSSLHESYEEGMEFNIATSVRLWYVFYAFIYRELTSVRSFEDKEQEVKFISIKYNSGKDYFKLYNSSVSVDAFVSLARHYDYSYHKNIWAIYQKNYENNRIFK